MMPTLSLSWSMLLRTYAVLFYAFLYVPIVVLVVLSFNDSPTMGFPFLGFTTKWYAHILSGDELAGAITNSVTIGTASAFISTALALLTSLGLRHQFPLKGFVFPMILVPIIMPSIVSGVLLLIFIGFAGLPYGLWSAVLPAHVTCVLPFAFLTLHPQIARFDPALEEAAMDLGAKPLEVFTRVLFPIIRPALIATLLFSFTISFDEFIRTLFVISGQRTVPIYLWVLIIERVAPFLPAIGVVLLAISMVIAGTGFVLSQRTSSETNP
jgi:ABC-type spermidine/putrescine transport system permease subunit II